MFMANMSEEHVAPSAAVNLQNYMYIYTERHV